MRQILSGIPMDAKIRAKSFIERWKYHIEQDYQFDIVTTIWVFLLIFVIGSVFGFIYEQLFYMLDSAVRGYAITGDMIGWSQWTLFGITYVKRGNQFGPYVPLYGVGAVAMCLILRRWRDKPWKVFVGAAVICGVLEYFVGWAMLQFAGVRSWDYNVEILNFGNIGGFVCLRSVLFFAVSGILLIYVVDVLVRMLAAHMKEKSFIILAAVPFSVFFVDFIINLMLGHGT